MPWRDTSAPRAREMRRAPTRSEALLRGGLCAGVGLGRGFGDGIRVTASFSTSMRPLIVSRSRWSARLTTTLAASKTLSATRSLRTMALPFCGWTRGSSNTNYPQRSASSARHSVTRRPGSHLRLRGAWRGRDDLPCCPERERVGSTRARDFCSLRARGGGIWRSLLAIGHSFVVADVSAKRSIVARRLHDRPLDVLHSCRSMSESLARVAEWQTQWI